MGNVVSDCRAEQYVSGRSATMLTGRNIYTILKSCLVGEVRWKAGRGENLKFHRGDLERLAAE
jgi:hypothetical protein